MLVGAGTLGVLTTFMIETLHRRGKLQQDASIGVTFTWLFALGVILISLYAGQVDLDQECVLYGEIAYGRIVHLEPVKWVDDWPLMGTGVETGAAKGEPVLAHDKPKIRPGVAARYAGMMMIPQTSDNFDKPALGLQWQWQANPGPDWFSLTAKPGCLRLFAQPELAPGNLYDAPNLLMQKFPALAFNATAVLESTTAAQTGLIVFGFDYAWIGVRDGRLVQVTVMKASEKPAAKETVSTDQLNGPVHLRVSVGAGAQCQFSYSLDGKTFTPLGEPFTASVGRWVGAKVGLFAAGAKGCADYDAFEVSAPGH